MAKRATKLNHKATRVVKKEVGYFLKRVSSNGMIEYEGGGMGGYCKAEKK